MIITNGDITLRAVEESDNDLLLTLINDPNIERMIGGKSFPVSRNDQINWYKESRLMDKSIRYMIDKKDETVGTIILSNVDYLNGNLEIHIKLLEKFQGMGIGTLSIKMLLNYIFNELRMEMVYAKNN